MAPRYLGVNIFRSPPASSLSVKVDPIAVDVRLMIDESLSLKAQSAFFAEFARDELARTLAINTKALGSSPKYVTFVDGRQSLNFESVRPTGLIIIEYELLQEMVAWIGAELVHHSPVGGPPAPAYIENHLFFVDGEQVEPGTPLPLTASSMVFVNAVPYARKIERGESSQAPGGVYQAVASLAQAKFGRLAKIRFDYVNMIAGAKSDRQPAIVITARPNG